MSELLAIERMSYGPDAVAHLADGRVAFVGGGVPGDYGEISVTEDHGSYVRATLTKLIEPSHFRVSDVPSCTRNCGGCPWAHMTYEAQLMAKRANVVNALTHGARFGQAQADTLVSPCVASQREWGYRNKLELAVEADRLGRINLGLRRGGSHDLVPIDTCPLAVDLIAKAPKALRGILRFIQGNQDLKIYRVGLRASLRTKSVEIALWTPPASFPRALAEKAMRSALNYNSLVRVLAKPGQERAVKKVEVLAGQGYWRERLAGNKFKVSSPSFFQVNTEQAERLVELVLANLCSIANRRVADLYAGVGTFSLPLAQSGAKVIAVEAAGSAVRDLKRNCVNNNVDIAIEGGDTGFLLPFLGSLDALVVDPPRAGLGKGVVESIAAAKPKTVIYISCAPQTWARDVLRLQRQSFELIQAVPVDLFPQTFHGELVSVFARTTQT